MIEETPTIFIAYSHKDKDDLDELRTILSPLIRNKKANIWFDGEIRPGAEWDLEIKNALYSADIILLLVSPNSLNSDYFYEKEVSDALERHRKGIARVIPVILKPCLWDETPLHEIQGLPRDVKPISTWQDRHSAWDDVARGIKSYLDETNSFRLKLKEKEEESERIKQLKNEEELIKNSVALMHHNDNKQIIGNVKKQIIETLNDATVEFFILEDLDASELEKLCITKKNTIYFSPDNKGRALALKNNVWQLKYFEINENIEILNIIIVYNKHRRKRRH